MRRAIVVLTIALPVLGSADEVFLKGGGKMTGEVVSEDGQSVVLEVGPGRVTVPAARVLRIERSRSPLGTYRERAARLAADDVQGWLELAFWAQERDLDTQAQEAFEHVLRLDPGNASANGALGRVQMDGRWMSQDESYRARGYVSFEGEWMTPAEHEARLRVRAAERQAAAAQREGELRVREAEARAQQAEAEARRAEAEAETLDLRRHSLLVGVGRVGDRAARSPLPPSDSAAEAAARGHPGPAAGSPSRPAARLYRRQGDVQEHPEAGSERLLSPRIDFRLSFA